MKGYRNTDKDFWLKVNIGKSDECWEFMGYRHERGYGIFSLSGRQITAHRYAWMRHNRYQIPKGMCILHHCDNPPCCNPSHLYCGTHSDNAGDKSIRGRVFSNLSQALTHARLHSREIWLIKKLLKARKIPQNYIAKMFKVSPSMISRIRHQNKHPCREGYYV